MKKYFVFMLLSVLLLVGAGCRKQDYPELKNKKPEPLSEKKEVVSPESEIISKEVVADQEENTHNQMETKLYRGKYFDIQYPADFIPDPVEPTIESRGHSYVQTDETTFTSPDGLVEFFIFSPLWAGDPKSYLDVKENEELVSKDSQEEDGPGAFDKEIITWVTIKDKDDAYYRSYVSIRDQVDSGSDVHHVFGIKYTDQAAYDQYKDAYIAFKESLHQYSD